LASPKETVSIIAIFVRRIHIARIDMITMSLAVLTSKLRRVLLHDSICGAQVGRPDGRAEQLGLGVLNEPAAEQADPTVLDLQLRVLTKEIQAWRLSSFFIKFFLRFLTTLTSRFALLP
jgi:hypothetical protein